MLNLEKQRPLIMMKRKLKQNDEQSSYDRSWIIGDDAEINKMLQQTPFSIDNFHVIEITSVSTQFL